MFTGWPGKWPPLGTKHRQMVVVYINRRGVRKVDTLEPKRDAWRLSKLNIIASFTTWHQFQQSSIYNDIRLMNSNSYID